jgi:endonuclease/exonuclease/phosphatase family metal-dependent hydrolase
VDTHLETSAAVNAAQAAELVAAIGVDLPVVVAGDLNSAPGERAHGVLVSAATGLRDAWAEAGSGPGPTCCHDAAVRDPAALPARRIDLVLVRGPIVVRSATVAGADPSAMRDGRWPSDHAGVAATLTLE